MRKGCVKAYIPAAMVLRLAAEAERRQVSMSTIINEALELIALFWPDNDGAYDAQLTGQSQLFPAVESLDNGA